MPSLSVKEFLQEGQLPQIDRASGFVVDPVKIIAIQNKFGSSFSHYVRA